jgi:hypothetical protein
MLGKTIIILIINFVYLFAGAQIPDSKQIRNQGTKDSSMITPITGEDLRKSQDLDSLMKTAKLLNFQLKELPCLLMYEYIKPESAVDGSLAAQVGFFPQDVIVIPVKDLDKADLYTLLLESMQENQYRVPAVIFPPMKWHDPNLEEKLHNTKGVMASITSFEGGKLWFPLTEFTRLELSGKTLIGQPKNCFVNIIPGIFFFDISNKPEGLTNPSDEHIEMMINGNKIKFKIFDGSLLGYPKYFKTLNEK